MEGVGRRLLHAGNSLDQLGAPLVYRVELHPSRLGRIRLVPDHVFQLAIDVTDLVVELFDDGVYPVQRLHGAEVSIQIVDDV